MSIVPKKAIRWCLGATIVIVFIIALLVALFVAGLAIYANLCNISLDQAWAMFIEAIRALMQK